MSHPSQRQRILCAFLCIAVLTVGGQAALGTAAETTAQQKLDASLRKLEAEIEAVRGLKFKSPVTAQILSRPADAVKGVQGYYSIKDKRLYLYDDIAGNYQKGVLIHEMVHALQDQHFGLAKLHASSFGSDAELALAALIEGDASFTMIELLKKEQPKAAAMMEVHLEKAKNLQNAFLYGQGARYVKALKEKGGWEAVNRAYRFTPDTTAAILHPEGVSTFEIGPGKTYGELGIIQMLVAHPATAPVAVQSAAGWKADREVQEEGATGWVVALTTKEQALGLQAALTKLWAAQKPGLKSTRVETGGSGWQGSKGELYIIEARGERVLAVQAPDRKTYQAVRDRLEGPLALQVYSARDKRQISFGKLIDRLLAADLVCVGESHDSELDHRVQLQIIKGLFARDERLGVGMEMFQRPFQKHIDRHFEGKMGEDEFLKATEYRQRWGYDWSLYRPILDFCRRNEVPLAALNVPRELTRRISKVGHAGLSAEEKQQLGPIDFHVKEHRAHWYELLPKMHGQKNATEEQKERSYQVMAAWDDYMATSAAQFQQERQLRRFVVLAGNGHIERGFGIPQRTTRRTGGMVATVGIVVGADLATATADPRVDYVILVR